MSEAHAKCMDAFAPNFPNFDCYFFLILFNFQNLFGVCRFWIYMFVQLGLGVMLFIPDFLLTYLIFSLWFSCWSSGISQQKALPWGPESVLKVFCIAWENIQSSYVSLYFIWKFWTRVYSKFLLDCSFLSQFPGNPCSLMVSHHFAVFHSSL